ncbi:MULTISPECIES: LysM peptidoglycan-binding domain-containing protein [unclassified Dermacoccus]|nr:MULTISPECIES: LysM peptidoglycan-binding domain-containing protein [unclassified Dermacoccus]MBZ4498370.1 LysM peptidoglycan-binding domain-containing protein [Dermacoccus sp. Tok2021]
MSAVPSLDVPAVAPSPRRHLHLVPSGPAVVDSLEGGRSTRRAPLTRRAVLARRRFAALLALLVLVGGGLLAAKAVAEANPAGGATSVTVKDGETLSQIAARELPSLRNDRGVVAIQEANNMSSMHVQAGQRILVPAG